MKTSKNFKKTALLTLLMTTFSINQVHAANQNTENAMQTHQEEKDNIHIGFGTGAVLGAIVAGPIGAIVTAAVGVFSANHYNVKDKKQHLEIALKQSNSSYETALETYQQKLFEAEQSYQEELLAIQQNQTNTSQLQAENLLMSFQFSTGSSQIKPHYNKQIDALANLLKQSTEYDIDLSGYTDLQGTEQRNHDLSIARVNSVKKALISRGIDPQRIQLFAFGEQQPVVANNQQQISFYDRRVVIKLHPNQNNDANQQTASN